MKTTQQNPDLTAEQKTVLFDKATEAPIWDTCFRMRMINPPASATALIPLSLNFKQEDHKQ
jgi:hypothetical protein